MAGQGAAGRGQIPELDAVAVGLWPSVKVKVGEVAMEVSHRQVQNKHYWPCVTFWPNQNFLEIHAKAAV